MTEEKESRKAVRRPTTIDESSYARTIWQLKPAPDVEVEDLLDSNYWAHIAKKMRAGDRIEAIPDDRHYFAELFVLGASSNWAKVILLRKHVLIEDNKRIEKEGYIVKFAGQHKWRVEKDGQILSKGHDDQKSAAAWLSNHIKDMT
jgi:hypothetical protein